MNNTKILRILAIILALSICSYWLVISPQTYATDKDGVITKPISSIYTLVQGSPTSMLIPYPVETMN